MTTGERLRKNLGLDSFRHAKITRVLMSSYKILLVIYDSHRPEQPIPNIRIKKHPSVIQFFHGSDIAHDDIDPVGFSMISMLDDYDGSLGNAIVCAVDISGYRFIDPDAYTRRYESKYTPEGINPMYTLQGKLPVIQEWLTLSDLKSKLLYSPMTMKFRKIRNKIMGAENITAKLIDIELQKDEDAITVKFLTTATDYTKPPYDEEPGEHQYFVTIPDEQWRLKQEKGEVYELNIKILKFFSWLQTTPIEHQVTTSDLKELLKTAYVQVHSEAPDFYWQGGAWYLTQLDGSIHKSTIAPKFWNQAKYHGNEPYISSKHLRGLLFQMAYFLNPIASMLSKKLRDRGFI